MVNICFISYYGLRESLLSASNSLTKYGHNIVNFSLMENEINENKKIVYDMLIDTIKQNKIDVVLWWYMGIATDKFEYVVKKTNVKNIFYNWDDPNGWIDRDMGNKAKYFDCVFSCCQESTQNYIDNGTTKAFHLLPGYDPMINNVIVSDDTDEYDCDISIICTQLYEKNINDMLQYINRKQLIDTIYENRNKYKFHIYGPEYLKELYPDCYKKYICYEEQNHVFNNSKINICTHTHCQFNKYFNERTILILGSGGLLYIDEIKGIEDVFKNGRDCIYIDKINYIDQIQHILANYDDYLEIRNNGNQLSFYYTWDKWGEYVHLNFLEKIKEFPKMTYNNVIEQSVEQTTETIIQPSVKQTIKTVIEPSVKQTIETVIEPSVKQTIETVTKDTKTFKINIKIGSEHLDKNIEINISI